MYTIIIILFTLALYLRTSFYSIIVDDIRRYKSIEKGFGKFQWWRPRQALIHIKNMFYGAGTFGRNTYTDHLTTTIMHTIVCVLIHIAFGRNPISFMAAMLYSCNPINNQTSIWLNGRRYAMCIIFVLLMIICKPWGIIFYPTALMFQMTGVFAPVLYASHNWLGLLLIPAFIYLSRKRLIRVVQNRFATILDRDHRQFKLKRLIVVVKCYGFYIFKMVFPNIAMVNYRTLYFWGLTHDGNKNAYSFNYEFFKGLLAIALSVAGMCYLKHDILCMWVFMCLAVLQWSGIVGSFQILADRYISLANVFMMFFVVYFLHLWLGPYALIPIAILFGNYIANLNIIMRMYRNIDDFFDYQLFFEPTLTKHRSFRINFFIKTNRMAKAWSLVEEGLVLSPNDFSILFDAARCSRLVGNFDKAVEFLNIAEKNFYVDQEAFQGSQIQQIRDQLVKDKEYIAAEQQKQMAKFKGQSMTDVARKHSRKKKR